MATKCVRIASAKVKWYQDMTPGELFRMRRRSLDAEKLIETGLCKLDCCDMSLEKKKILDHEKMCRYRPVPCPDSECQVTGYCDGKHQRTH